MTGKNFLGLAVAMGAGAFALFNLDRVGGCFDNIQMLDLELGEESRIACSRAVVAYVSQSGAATELEVDCGHLERVVLYGTKLSSEVCGMRFQATRTWEGGPVTHWNVALQVTWEAD